MSKPNQIIVTVLLAVLSFLLPACHNAKRVIADDLAVARTAANQVSQDASGATQSLKAADESLEVSGRYLGQALAVPGQPDAGVVAITKAQEFEANARKHVSTAAARVEDISQTATKVTVAVVDAQETLPEVENKPTFWSQFTGWIYWGGICAILLTVSVFAWRFGLDRLVKALLAFLSGPLESLGNWMHNRWDGIAKLSVETTKGETSPVELVAALRGAFPQLDRKIKENGNA